MLVLVVVLCRVRLRVRVRVRVRVEIWRGDVRNKHAMWNRCQEYERIRNEKLKKEWFWPRCQFMPCAYLFITETPGVDSHGPLRLK